MHSHESLRGLILVKRVMDPNRDMPGDSKLTDSRAVLLPAARVRIQTPSGRYIPEKHLMNPSSVCLNIDHIEY